MVGLLLVGTADGARVGAVVLGNDVGGVDGAALGAALGEADGAGVGAVVLGNDVGGVDGAALGAALGVELVGAPVGSVVTGAWVHRSTGSTAPWNPGVTSSSLRCTSSMAAWSASVFHWQLSMELESAHRVAPAPTCDARVKRYPVSGSALIPHADT